MALESCRIDSSRSQRSGKIFPPMQPLSARGDFKSLKQKIEATCRSIRSSWSGVKRTRREWETQNENSGNSVFLLGQFAKLALAFGSRSLTRSFLPYLARS